MVPIPLMLLLLGTTLAAEQETKVIRQVLDEQAVAWNQADLEGFMKGYWKSDKLTFISGGEKTAGWQATLERYRKKYQGEGKEMGKLSFDELEIELLSARQRLFTEEE